jgi:class 3 adenylate cyclase
VKTLFDELSSTGNKTVNLELDIGAIEGLKKMPVDMFDGVYLGEANNKVLVLCVDVRNFSDFLCSNEEDTVFKLIKEFTSNLLSCINQYGYGCSYYKLMGDGALVIWDETTENTINEALFIFDSYTDFLNEELFKPYNGLGLGGALVEEEVFKYEISAEVSQLKYRDYVGYGINLACRLQTLAGVNELVLNEMLAKTKTVPFRVDDSQEILKELKLLKGLKEEDRKRVLVYERRLP